MRVNIRFRGNRYLRALIIVISTFGYPAHAQYEVAEIPFFNTPKGTAALGGGIRLGQDLYIAAVPLGVLKNGISATSYWA